MLSFSKIAKSSQLINLLFLISTLVAVSTFSCLGIHEFNSMKEIRHIVNADVKNIHFVLWGLIITTFILAFMSFFIFIYIRRLKSIKLTEQLLDELLYYNQIDAMNTTLNLPVALKRLQLNRDLFFSELQRGLANNQFRLYYQPIVNIKTGIIVDAEVLIRWQHPICGFLSPDAFLPLCENTGFILPLGEWVFKTACQQLRQWHDMGFSKLRLSINLSARQLADDNLFYLIKNTLIQNKLSPAYLKLEITESALMKDVNMAINILKSLRQIGLELSLDDFGTGYSSLSYLKQLPITNLKIDKSFIHDITSTITSLGIVESVISLAKNLGLTITAEGVENNEQLHALKKMQCDLVQGYLYSKPIPGEEFTHLLSTSEIKNNKF